MLWSFRKLPPSELPATRTRVNSGKNAPPRTSTSEVAGVSTMISYVLWHVLMITRSSGVRPSTRTPSDHECSAHVSRSALAATTLRRRGVVSIVEPISVIVSRVAPVSSAGRPNGCLWIRNCLSRRHPLVGAELARPLSTFGRCDALVPQPARAGRHIRGCRGNFFTAARQQA